MGYFRFLQHPALRLLRSVASLACVAGKVTLLLACELGLFPTFCGLCMDWSSMALFGASKHSRLVFARHSPFTFVLLHWMLGITFMFYCASLVGLLRRLLRPQVLWFIRDPETFNPLQEMLEAHHYFTHTQKLEKRERGNIVCTDILCFCSCR
jgi:E3 ubiquitin-protein ligase DOA10